MEDDCIIIDDYKKTLKDLIVNVAKSKTEQDWDVLLTGIAHNSPGNKSPTELHDVMTLFKIIPQKECYLVTKTGARKLLESVKELTMPLRYHFSALAYKNEVKMVHPTCRATVDSSKLGLHPSTIHSNNMLILNQEYMEMWNAFTCGKPIDIAEIRATFNKIKHINSADAYHLYAVILYKCNQFEEAADMFDKAFEEIPKKGGLLNSRSDLMNNTIQFYQIYQRDLDEIRKKKSRYV